MFNLLLAAAFLAAASIDAMSSAGCIQPHAYVVKKNIALNEGWSTSSRSFHFLSNRDLDSIEFNNNQANQKNCGAHFQPVEGWQTFLTCAGLWVQFPETFRVSSPSAIEGCCCSCCFPIAWMLFLGADCKWLQVMVHFFLAMVSIGKMIHEWPVGDTTWSYLVI